MKKIIFIDTNIYLRFYDSNSSEFKKLLKSLDEAKNAIFVTQQIVDETCRNKLDVFLRSMNGYIKQFSLSKVILPEHLETDDDAELKEWNLNTNELDKKSKEQVAKLKTITTTLLKNISNNEDQVSKNLFEIFEKANKPNEDQFSRARLRKELGNPPGKKNDPIGDELSWEQLLSNIKTTDELWIVSNDTDYLFEFNKECYLNPLLYSELLAQNSKLKVNVFNTLSQGLSSYNKSVSKKMKTLPTGELLDKITKEEKAYNFNSPLFARRPNPLNPFDFRNSMPQYRNYKYILDEFRNVNYGSLCPNCGKSLSGPHNRSDEYGNISQELYCASCDEYYKSSHLKNDY